MAKATGLLRNGPGGERAGAQRSEKYSSGWKDDTATSSKPRTPGSDLTSKGFERHHVKHNYHDYATFMTVSSERDSSMASKASGGVNNPFPTVLHKLLSETEKLGFDNIISWQPHGRSFLIHRPKDFIKDVVPKYFKHSKLSSFQRQLSLYGFVRLTNEGPDKNAYYHELFLRGRPFLCTKIQRTRVKGTWVRTSSSPESEPDFFSMEPVVESEDNHVDISPSNETTLGERDQPAYVTPRLLSQHAPNNPFGSASSMTNLPLDDMKQRDQQCSSDEDTVAIISSSSSTASDSNARPPPSGENFGLQPPPPLANHSLFWPGGSCDGSSSFPSKEEMRFSSICLSSLANSSSILLAADADDNAAGLFPQHSMLHRHHQKWRSCEMASLSQLGKALSCPTLFDDDELGSFLREIDLGMESEMADDILQTAAL